MKLRWIENEDHSLQAVQMLDGKCYRLQYWQQRLVSGHAGGVDYSDDGEWMDVEVDKDQGG